MIKEKILSLVLFSTCLALIKCAPHETVDFREDNDESMRLERHEMILKGGGEKPFGEREKRADPPWWCNAAVTKCNGGEDPCCAGYWANPKDACQAACAQCNRSC